MNHSPSSPAKNAIVRNFNKTEPSQRPTFRSWESARGATASQNKSSPQEYQHSRFSILQSRDFRAILAFSLAAAIAAGTYFFLNAH